MTQRLGEYMLKAAREAKLHTSWIHQNDGYETALLRFIERTLDGPASRRFRSAFLPFQARVAELGMVNSLSQVVLKTLSPGVPDFYQGTELWDLSLVDPDNRRSVDYGHRRRLLDGMKEFLATAGDRRQALGEIVRHWPDGRVKMFVTATLLALRRRHAELFLEGTYEPLQVRGERAEHVVAFARRHASQGVVVVAPRLIAPLTGPSRPLPLGPAAWGDTEIVLPADVPTGGLREVFSGAPVVARERDGRVLVGLGPLLESCPVAVLTHLAPLSGPESAAHRRGGMENPCV